MSKIAWIDTETTGLNPKTNALIQLSGLIEVDGSVKESFDFFLRPWNGAVVEPEALAVNGRSIDEISNFQDHILVIHQFRTLLSKYANKYDKDDKFVFAGYNPNFDIGFLRETFLKAGDNYYGSWFFNCPLDVATIVAEKVVSGLRLPNYKLVTVCEHYSIGLEDAHSSDNDIRATRELYYTLKGNGDA